MLRVIAFALATTVLAGCARSGARPNRADGGQSLPKPTRRPSPKPQYGTFGFDTAGMDRNVRAGRQFLPVRKRHLGEEHADPGRQAELRRVQFPRRFVAHPNAGTARASEGRSQFEDRHCLRDLSRHGSDRGQGSGADRALAEPGPRLEVESWVTRRWLRRPLAMASACPSPPLSARTARTPTFMR